MPMGAFQATICTTKSTHPTQQKQAKAAYSKKPTPLNASGIIHSLCTVYNYCDLLSMAHPVDALICMDDHQQND
jgi:hypothetical protein